LSENEVEKMRQDAELHADDDRKRKEMIEARNNADNMAYAADKALKEFGEKVPAEVRSDIETKTAAVRQAAQGEDIDAIRKATEALGEAIQKIGASVYESQASAGPSNGTGTDSNEQGPSTGEPEGDVIDGEVKE
jgi:molecular chaperone DnaK